ncbi:hypothetical protein CerSpe_216290 [Prunus speciosa]
MFNYEGTVLPLLPAIWKPERLWTGKQVITALLNHITRGSPPVTVEKDAKIPHDFFNCKNVEGEYKSDKDGQQKEKKPNKEQATNKEKSKEKEEHDENHLLIYRNNLVRGVIDKAQFGDFGLVHTVQEFYGSDTAGKLLSVLSHLFTSYLQMHGFTCGVDDLLLLESEDTKMMDQRESCEDVGEKVYSDFIKFKDVKRNGMPFSRKPT